MACVQNSPIALDCKQNKISLIAWKTLCCTKTSVTRKYYTHAGLCLDVAINHVASTRQLTGKEAFATTVMMVGKSGSGKSVLGNKLLNVRRGPIDDYEMYFEEGGGAAGVSGLCKSRTSKDKSMQVIETPGIPDPPNHKTIGFFDAIVKKIRELDALNLLVFLVHEDRTNETQFDEYRVLLKQFNYVPREKLMVCR